MDLKDLKESNEPQVYPHLRWACFNPPFPNMFLFSPASLALLLLPIRQTFDNVTPKLQTRDIGESFYSTRSTQSPRKVVTWQHYITFANFIRSDVAGQQLF